MIFFFTAVSIVQTKAFQFWLKNRIENSFAESTEGKLEIWKLQIRFPFEVVLEEPRLTLPSDKNPTISAEKITLKLDFFDVLNNALLHEGKTVIIEEISLHAPMVRLIQLKNGDFNFSSLIKPDTGKSELPKMKFKAITITNGELLWHRRLSLAPSGEDAAQLRSEGIEPINLEDIHFSRLSLSLSAETDRELISGMLNHLSFQIHQTGFELNEGSGFFSLGATRLDLIAFMMKTNSTDISFSSSLSRFPILGSDSDTHSDSLGRINSKPLFTLELKSSQFHISEFKPFFPFLYGMQGTCSFYLKGGGNTDSISISRFNAKVGDTKVDLTGEILNPLDPLLLSFSFDKAEGLIDIQNLAQQFPRFDLSNAPEIGIVRFTGSAKGTKNSVTSAFNVVTEIGKVNGVLEVLNPSDSLKRNFSGSFEVGQLDLSSLLKSEVYTTNLNCKGRFSGSGYSAQTLELFSYLQIQSSTFLGRQIDTAMVTIEYEKRLLSANLTLNSGKEEVSLLSEINFQEPSKPKFSFDGSFLHLSLGKWLMNDSLSTDLSFRYEINGENFTLKDISLNASLTFDTSRFGKLVFPSGTTATLILLQNQGDASLSLRSSLADAEIDGHFDLESLFSIIDFETRKLSAEIESNQFYGTSDTSSSRYSSLISELNYTIPASDPKQKNSPPIEISSVSVYPDLYFDYSLKLKSISELAPVFKAEAFNASGKLTGKFITTTRSLTINSNLQIDSAGYARLFDIRRLRGTSLYRDTLVAIDSSTLRFYPSVRFRGDAFRASSVNQDFFRSNFGIRYDSTGFGINLRSTNANTNGLIDLIATGKFQRGFYILDISNFSFATRDYLWEMKPGAHAEVGSNAIQFKNFELQNNNQKIFIDGTLESTGNGKINVSIQNFLLSDIRQFVFENPDTRLEGAINLDLNIEGNLNSPIIKLRSSLNDFSYETIDIGNLSIDGNYSKEILALNFKANVDSNLIPSPSSKRYRKNHIIGNLEFPINLQMVEVEDRLPDKPVKGQLSSTDIDAKILEFFMPFLTNTTGDIRLDGEFGGSSKKLSISLLCMLTDVRSVIYGTETPYVFNGEVRITPDLIDWNRLRLDDDAGGYAFLNGKLELDFFSPKNITISAIARNFTLMQKPDSKGSDYFGVIRGSTDNIRLSGTLDQPYLTGTVTLGESDLTQYRSGSVVSQEFAEANKFISTVFVEDTLIKPKPPEDPTLNLGIQTGSETFFSESKVIAYQPTFLDLLEMNLTLQSSQRFSYAMIFNRLISESLSANLDQLRLRIQKKSGVYTVYGDAIVSGGTYDFYSTRFDIRPGSRIYWESGSFLDAKLDINAGYSEILRIPGKKNAADVIDFVSLSLKILGTIMSPDVKSGYSLRENSAQATEILYKEPNSTLEGTDDPYAFPNFVLLLYARQWYAKPGELSQVSLGNAIQGAFAGAGLTASAGLLSAQLSRLTSKIAGIQSINVGIGRDAQGGISGLDLSLAYSIPGTGGKLTFVGAASNLGSATNQTQTSENPNDPQNLNQNLRSSNTQRLEYQFSRSIVFEAYRAENAAQFNTLAQVNPTVWGFSVGYRENFRSWNEFFDRWGTYVQTLFGLLGEEPQRKENKALLQASPDSSRRINPTDSLQNQPKTALEP
ncbi:MAG: hypothetical protein SFU91_09620 [Chloroherpetonaceae bacterium]|nr:hypothetical protein [Chloroherpetonaceae bacterium]